MRIFGGTVLSHLGFYASDQIRAGANAVVSIGNTVQCWTRLTLAHRLVRSRDQAASDDGGQFPSTDDERGCRKKAH